jgi:hypothetical protein
MYYEDEKCELNFNERDHLRDTGADGRVLCSGRPLAVLLSYHPHALWY